MAERTRHRFWLGLMALPGVGPVNARALAERLGGADRVFDANDQELASAEVHERLVSEIRGFRGWAAIDREIARAQQLGLDLVCLDDERYPIGLRFTHAPPPVLYVRGRIERGDLEAIAIVGSRAASPYGLAVADRLARELAAAGVTVVSGLAIGIDGAAHRGALAGGGRTIAVLGCGADQVYPPRHRRLAEEVAATGAVVSEFSLGTPPEAHNFPRRNRIVSGLSLGVVVVEATDKSGSLITARLALAEGREVLAVPGEVGLERTRGTHRLLRQGARLIESGADILAEVLPWRRSESASSGWLPSADQARVLAGFQSTVEHVDHLIERSGIAAARVLEILLDLELAGRVARHPGMTFSRAG